MHTVWFGRIQRIAPLHIPRCYVRVLLSGWGDEYGGARRLAPSLQRLQSGFWKFRADSRTGRGTAAGSAPHVFSKAERRPHHHHCRTRERFCQSQWSHRCRGGKRIRIGKFLSFILTQYVKIIIVSLSKRQSCNHVVVPDDGIVYARNMLSVSQ